MLKFLAMGGYARYVWPCYTLTVLVVGLNIFWANSLLRTAKADAARRLASARVTS